MPPITPNEENRADDFARAVAAAEYLVNQREATNDTVTGWTAVAATALTSKYEEKKKNPTPKIDDALLLELREATKALLQETRNRQRSLNRWHMAKEAEYFSLVLRDKHQSKTPSEFLNSELPIQVAGVSQDYLLAIAHTDATRSVQPDKRNGIKISCSGCGIQADWEYMFFCYGSAWCAIHVPMLELCGLCQNLRQGCSFVKSFDGHELHICSECLENRALCSMCSKQLPKEYAKVKHCGDCLKIMRDDALPYRRFSMGLEWVEEGRGDIVKSTRMFSCEIEAMSPEDSWAIALHRALPKETGIGTDGSVGVRGQCPYGFEVQTPRLGGKKGEQFIHKMLAGLKVVQPTLDSTCGMHIHLDGRGIMPKTRHDYPEALVQLLRASIVFEDVTMSFLPHSRRRNDYCRPLAEAIHPKELDMVETIVDVEKLWYMERSDYGLRSAKGHHYHASRYFASNFHPLLSQGHFEIRSHTGTLNARKILEWANLHALIMDACEASKLTIDVCRKARQFSRLSDKTELLFGTIGLSEQSRQYFRARQRKFGESVNRDEEVGEPSKKKKLPGGRFRNGTGIENQILTMEGAAMRLNADMLRNMTLPPFDTNQEN